MMTGKLYFLLLVLLVSLVGYIEGQKDGEIHCSSQWNKWTFRKFCKKYGKIKGIKITRKNFKRVRYYSCKHPARVLNIPTSSEFNCCLNKTDGLHRWHSVHNYNLIADRTTLKCEVKNSMCPSPPTPGDHMTVREISRYMRPEIKDDVQYYEGDTLEYACKPGFETVVNDYDTDTSSQITCNSSHTWDYTNIEKCQEIVCDATYFKDIPNGRIPGYKESYKYGEYMELVCYDGYGTRDHVYSVRCEHSDSFHPLNLRDFRCLAIQCPRPPTILNAHLPYYTDRFIHSTVTFICDNGYTLSGKETWRCQENGKWDGNCVKCNADETYCPASCVPEGAVVLNPLPTYYLGIVINFTCSEDMPYGAPVSRECLRNRLWSGDEINCLGGPVAVSNLLSKLRSISENQNGLNVNGEVDGVRGKTINVGSPGGVDVFIMADISGSVSNSEFDKTKAFIKALLPALNISDDSHGTRLALYMFATNVLDVKYDHYKGDTTTEEWTKQIDKLDRINVQNKTHKGTSFETALKDIRSELESKQKDWKQNVGRISQQVLIMISDGLNNHGGDIVGLASELKDVFHLEIISVCIQLGTKVGKTRGAMLMKNIASNPKNENFFYISEERQTMDKIIETMIRTDKWKRKDTDEDVETRYEFEKPILHEKYDKSVEPAYVYDIALIHVSPEIEFTSQTHAVCLPNKTDELYGQVFKDEPTQYGVVTGWGKWGRKVGLADTMKQMTMEIKSNESCIAMMKNHGQANHYNSWLMFCAGGKDEDGTMINTYGGDSGGPFSVYFEEGPWKDRFVQIGIVSFGLNGKEASTNGIYTRITPELRQWIEDKVNP